MSLAARIFGIPEILEIILVHVPATHLISVQRVDKTWQQTITSSISIQQMLFLKPIDKYPEKTGLVSHQMVSPRKNSPFVWNPCAPLFEHAFPGEWKHPRCKVNEAKLKQLCDVDSRWKTMYVTQPPATEMKVIAQWRGDGVVRARLKLFLVSNEDGITLAQLQSLQQDSELDSELVKVSLEIVPMNLLGSEN